VPDAQDLLRTHITLCLDISHTPSDYTNYEEHAKAIELQGISIGKKQLETVGLNASGLDKKIVSEVSDVMRVVESKKTGLKAQRAA